MHPGFSFGFPIFRRRLFSFPFARASYVPFQPWGWPQYPVQPFYPTFPPAVGEGTEASYESACRRAKDALEDYQAAYDELVEDGLSPDQIARDRGLRNAADRYQEMAANALQMQARLNSRGCHTDPDDCTAECGAPGYFPPAYGTWPWMQTWGWPFFPRQRVFSVTRTIQPSPPPAAPPAPPAPPGNGDGGGNGGGNGGMAGLLGPRRMLPMPRR